LQSNQDNGRSTVGSLAIT